MQGPQSVTLNPALVSVFQKVAKKKVVAGTSIGKFGEAGILAGGAVSVEIAPENLVVADFLYQNSNRENKDLGLYKATVAIAGPMVKEQEQELHLGINLSYYNNNRVKALIDSLPVITTTTENDVTTIDTAFYQVNSTYEHIEQLVAMDVGFFQVDINKSMTFSLVAENVLGYRWLKERPLVINDTSIIGKDSSYFAEQEYATKWIDGNLKSLLIGGASRIPITGNDMLINIPIDVRFWGFLSKDVRKSTKLKERVEVFTGIEVYKGEHIGARFGHAWRNKENKTNADMVPQFEPEHLFSGGFSFRYKTIIADLHWAKETFGGGLTFGF